MAVRFLRSHRHFLEGSTPRKLGPSGEDHTRIPYIDVCDYNHQITILLHDLVGDSIQVQILLYLERSGHLSRGAVEGEVGTLSKTYVTVQIWGLIMPDI